MVRTSMSLVLLLHSSVKKPPETFVVLPTVRCVGSSLTGRPSRAMSVVEMGSIVSSASAA